MAENRAVSRDVHRIDKHPILPVEMREDVVFLWRGRELVAKEGETIASALFANGVRIFGHHPKDGAPQGIFCANGQCAQCLVLADGARSSPAWSWYSPASAWSRSRTCRYFPR